MATSSLTFYPILTHSNSHRYVCASSTFSSQAAPCWRPCCAEAVTAVEGALSAKGQGGSAPALSSDIAQVVDEACLIHQPTLQHVALLPSFTCWSAPQLTLITRVCPCLALASLPRCSTSIGRRRLCRRHHRTSTARAVGPHRLAAAQADSRCALSAPWSTPTATCIIDDWLLLMHCSPAHSSTDSAALAVADVLRRPPSLKSVVQTLIAPPLRVVAPLLTSAPSLMVNQFPPCI